MKQADNISLQSEFIKAFPPFLIYLATVIILLSFFKDLVRVGFNPEWLLIRVCYFPFVVTIWKISKRIITTRFYETPLWIAGLYITIFCTYFSFATGGLRSDYIYGLIQLYFAIAVMPLRPITFYTFSLVSVGIYIGTNIVKFGSASLHDHTTMSTIIPLLVFSFIVYFITSRIRNAKIDLQNKLEKTIFEREAVIQSQSKKLAEIETKAALGLIAAQMAHDIRSPLNALRVISKELSGLPKSLQWMTQESINRIHDIADNLLKKYKLKSSHLIYHELSPELIQPILDSVMVEKKIQCANKKIIFNYYTDELTQDIFVELEPIEFKRMISNLVNNAVESIVDSGLIEVILTASNDLVTIKIKDNGCGISTEQQPCLFQEGKTTKKNGLGLGLYHAKNTIQLIGGDIKIDSKINMGTTITLRLPRIPMPAFLMPNA